MSVTLVEVGHAFPGQPYLFRHLSTTFAQGALTAIVGPSGSGKSTLLGAVAGWVCPTEGDVRVQEGVSTAWVFQNPFGVARRTVLDHVCLPLLARGLHRPSAERRARAVLEMFGLHDRQDREFRALSGGEGQRLMLARAVAAEPELILVDEPTAQLDLTSSAAVVAVLRHLATDGRTVVIATHDPRVQEACDAVLDLACYQDVAS